MATMSFSMLPQELLAHILAFDISSSAVELWRSGDRRLMAKLRSGGILEVTLSSSKDASPLQTWPRCLKEFRLRSLLVQSSTPLLPCSSLRSELMRHYPGLTDLRLFVPGALEAFSNDPETFLTSSSPLNAHGLQSDLPHIGRLFCDSEAPEDAEEAIKDDFSFEIEPPAKRSKSSSGDSNQTLSDMWDVHRAFPSLKVLKIADYQSNKVKSLSIPSTVTTLGLAFHDDVGPCVDWSTTLPPSLETLELSAAHWRGVDFFEVKRVLNALPKSLTLLKGSNPFLARVIEEPLNGQWSHISIDSSTLLPLSRYSDSEMVPPRVDKLLLSVPIFPLPDSIKVLHYNSVVTNLPRLPSSLTNLNICLDWRLLTAFPPGPTNLTTLRCHFGVFGSEHFHLLPRTLTQLDQSSNHGHGSTESVSDQRLLELGLAAITGSDAENWKQAKIKLLEFAKTRNGDYEGTIEAYIAQVEKGALFGLPVNLNGFSCCFSYWPSSRTMTLPPKLRSFASTLSSVVNSTHFFALLPLSLTCFTLSSGGMPSLALNMAEPTIQLYNMPFMREMTFTNLNDKILASFIPFLPRTLIALSLSLAVHSPKGAWFADLPPLLETLKLDCLAIIPAGAWLQHLPRTLISLQLCGAPINSPDLVNLPPQLVTLNGARMRNFDFEALSSLPRTLKHFNVLAPKRRVRGDGENWVEMSGWSKLCESFKPFKRIFQASHEEIMAILK